MTDLVSRQEISAWMVMIRSFRPNLNAVESRLAFLETISHLEHLRLKNRITAEERDGRSIYRGR
jgi:hypothetical protein